MTWTNMSGLDVDIVFDNPAAVMPIPDEYNFVLHLLAPDATAGAIGGDIPLLKAVDPSTPSGQGFDGRYFPTPGTYVFRMTAYPSAVDTIVVVP